MTDWIEAETNTHQDHVIAHVIGATVLGFFVWDETAFFLLDIGFIWNVYLDGEMGLVPHPVAINELEAPEPVKIQLRADVDLLLMGNQNQITNQIIRPSFYSPVQGVNFSISGSSRLLLLTCEEEALRVETSLETREVKIYEL